MKKISNKTRREAGKHVVRDHFVEINGVRVNSDLDIMHREDALDAIVDAITDILHYAKSEKMSLDYIMRTARAHVEEETK